MTTCYVFGALPTRHRPTLQAGDLLIAADAGVRSLNGLSPDLIVGDFDSLGYVPTGVNVVRHPVRKDDTDTLLALREGLARSYRRFVLLGSSGGRLDLTLANIQALSFLAAHGARGFLQGEFDCAAVVENEALTLTGGCGRVSVFALDNEVESVTLQGLDYPLTEAPLTDRFPLGVSNAFVPDTPAVIRTSGRLLVLWDGDWQQASYGE